MKAMLIMETISSRRREKAGTKMITTCMLLFSASLLYLWLLSVMPLVTGSLEEGPLEMSGEKINKYDVMSVHHADHQNSF